MDDISNWQPVYRDLSTLLGPDVARQLHQHFGGSEVTFPMQLLSHEGRIAAIRHDASTGQSIKSLAQAYHLSQRTIRNYLRPD